MPAVGRATVVLRQHVAAEVAIEIASDHVHMVAARVVEFDAAGDGLGRQPRRHTQQADQHPP